MQSNKLDNCRICGRLFIKDHTDYCLDCYKEIEQDYKRVDAVLKDERFRFVTIEELSELTEVSVKQIAEFMRDGRIYAEDYPNLGYPCAHCEKLIKRQVLCNECYEQFSSDINLAFKRDKLVDEMNKPKIHMKNAQYWQLKNDK